MNDCNDNLQDNGIGVDDMVDNEENGMVNYYRLLSIRNRTKRLIRDEKRRLRVVFQEHNKEDFKWMLIVMLCGFIMNIGAVVITNTMVAQKGNVVFMEMNPVQAKINNYQEHPQSNTFLPKILIQIGFWFVLIFIFVWMWRMSFTHEEIAILWALTIVIFIILSFDFWNDVGYWIGMLLSAS